MNKETITIQDCLEMYYREGKITVIENGQVIKFEKENQDAMLLPNK